MSVLVVKTILYRGVLALLEAPGSVLAGAAEVGNRLRLTDADPERIVPLADRGPKDYPAWELRFGRWVYPGWDRTGRYSYNAAGVPVGQAKELRQGFQLVLTHQTTRAADTDPLDVAVVEQLEAAGPTMGLCPSPLPHVRLGEIEAAPTYGEAGGQLRQQTVFTFAVVARWKGDPMPRQTI